MEETLAYLREWNKESAEKNYERHCQELKDEGRSEGINQRNIEIAKSLIKENVAKDLVMRTTGISEKEYNKLISK